MFKRLDNWWPRRRWNILRKIEQGWSCNLTLDIASCKGTECFFHDTFCSSSFETRKLSISSRSNRPWNHHLCPALREQVPTRYQVTTTEEPFNIYSLPVGVKFRSCVFVTVPWHRVNQFAFSLIDKSNCGGATCYSKEVTYSSFAAPFYHTFVRIQRMINRGANNKNNPGQFFISRQQRILVIGTDI